MHVVPTLRLLGERLVDAGVRGRTPVPATRIGNCPAVRNHAGVGTSRLDALPSLALDAQRLGDRQHLRRHEIPFVAHLVVVDLRAVARGHRAAVVAEKTVTRRNRRHAPVLQHRLVTRLARPPRHGVEVCVDGDTARAQRVEDTIRRLPCKGILVRLGRSEVEAARADELAPAGDERVKREREVLRRETRGVVVDAHPELRLLQDRPNLMAVQHGKARFKARRGTICGAQFARNEPDTLRRQRPRHVHARRAVARYERIQGHVGAFAREVAQVQDALRRDRHARCVHEQHHGALGVATRNVKRVAGVHVEAERARLRGVRARGEDRIGDWKRALPSLRPKERLTELVAVRVRQVRDERGRAIHELRAKANVFLVGFVLNRDLCHARLGNRHLEEDGVGTGERLRPGERTR